MIKIVNVVQPGSAMCSRYEINGTFEEVSLRFDVTSGPSFQPMAEVRPTNRVPVITEGGSISMLRWGLDVSWDNKPLINARAETLAQKKTFRPLLEARCLVPASAYFEWRTEAGAKIKTRIHNTSESLFAMAGLTDGDNFTIVTVAPSPAIAHIHSRMPVIVDAGSETSWLDPNLDFAAAATVLGPPPVDSLAWHDAEPPPRQKDLFR